MIIFGMFKIFLSSFDAASVVKKTLAGKVLIILRGYRVTIKFAQNSVIHLDRFLLILEQINNSILYYMGKLEGGEDNHTRTKSRKAKIRNRYS